VTKVYSDAYKNAVYDEKFFKNIIENDYLSSEGISNHSQMKSTSMAKSAFAKY